MEKSLIEAKRIVDEINKEAALRKVEELIKDNIITFDYNERQYRVRLLNMAEKEEFDNLRKKKYGQLLQDKDILLSKDLIKIYKDRGINIDEIDEQTKKLEVEEKDVMIQLGESLSKNEEQNVLSAYEENLAVIKQKKQVLFTQKTLLLEASLENQLESYAYKLVIYLSSEIKVEDTWKKLFKNMDEFSACEDEKLITQLGQYSILLQTF